MKILVADDERYVREEIMEILDGLDISAELEAYYCADGIQVLEQALLTPPDLLLTDIRMPRMDGLSLATQIHTLFPDCKLIFLSNYSEKEYLMQAIKLQVTAYIDKLDLEEALPGFIYSCFRQYKNLQSMETRLISKNLSEYRSILLKLWSQMLRSKTADLDSIKQQCFMYGLGHLYTAAYRCVFIKCRLPLSSMEQYAEIRSFLEKKDIFVLSCDTTLPDLLVLFLYTAQKEQLEDSLLHRIFQKLHMCCKPESSGTDGTFVGMSAGPIADTCYRAIESYQIAKAAYNQLFYTEDAKLILLENCPGISASILTESCYRTFSKKLSDLDIKDTIHFIDSIFDELSSQINIPSEDVKAFFNRCISHMIRVSEDYYLGLHKESHQMQKDINNAFSLAELKLLVKQWLYELDICDIGDERIIRTVLS